MNSVKHIAGILLIVIFIIGCNDQWDKHYGQEPITINENVWEAIQRDSSLSKFVELVKKYEYDTLFLSNKTFTFFVPSNTALTNFIDSAENSRALLSYNISEFYILSENINGLRKIQTLGEKYALFYKSGNSVSLDGVPLKYESPLYLNGKYYIMDALASPKLNLYEYIAINNPVLKAFIDDLDTLILDKVKSRPIGFDDQGNTIYDTVATLENIFEMEFFPIKHESRYKTATLVFPKSEDYNAGLNLMAQTLGGNYHDYRDIPMDWQNKVLIPYLLERGVFENMLEEPEFVLNPAKNDTLRLKNILGDSVDIKYEVAEKTLCSNGYAYNYKDFKVPDTLWNSTYRFEGEHLVRNIGAGRWAWKDNILVSNRSFSPVQDRITGASKDSTLRVMLTPNKYNGTYTVEFNIDRLFPRKYLMVVRTNSNYGGKYRVYVNGTLLKTIDYLSLTSDRGYPSVIPGVTYRNNTARFINYDLWIDNLTTYGQAKIKFEYYGPSTNVPYSALVIDYIDFKPY